MIVMVDEDRKPVKGFGYKNKRGTVETVESYGRPEYTYFKIKAGSDHVDIYYEDIPKLIRALEAMQSFRKAGGV